MKFGELPQGKVIIFRDVKSGILHGSQSRHTATEVKRKGDGWVIPNASNGLMEVTWSAVFEDDDEIEIVDDGSK